MESKLAHIYCPDPKPETVFLTQAYPMALTPALGRPLLGLWLERLHELGIRSVKIYASDRPEKIREYVKEGEAWGLRVEVHSSRTDPTQSPEFLQQLRENTPAQQWPDEEFLIRLDHLPFSDQGHLIQSENRILDYETWFKEILKFAPNIIQVDPHGLQEWKPGIMVGIRTRIDETATIHAPCWIGEGVTIGPGATIGPDTVIESHSIVADQAIIRDSWIWNETFVGELTEVNRSFVNGSIILNWRTGSQVIAPDDFLLCSLRKRQPIHKPASVLGRMLALAVLALTFPIGLVALGVSQWKGISWLARKLAVIPIDTELGFAEDQTIPYREFPAFNGLLRRWPQLWNILIGEFHWVGNRPLSPGEAKSLENDFERLWLKSPIGLVSLSDAEGRGEEMSDDAKADAGFYSAQPNFRLKLRILRKCLFRF